MSTRETEVRETLVYQLSGAPEPPIRNRGGRPRTRPHHIKITRPPASAQVTGMVEDRTAPERPLRYVGLDTHAETITVAVADADGSDPRLYGTIPATPEAVRKLLHKLGAAHRLAVVYEAGPTGYWLWHLCTTLEVPCEIAAPSLTPKRAGDRVKTDRRDALKLALFYRARTLELIVVPDAEHEALRDLVRAREQALYDRTRARHRLSMFLLRRGIRRPRGACPWTTRHRKWLVEQVAPSPALAAPELTLVFAEALHEIDRHTERLERYEAAIMRAVPTLAPQRQAVIAALQALKGIAFLSAVTIVSELGTLSRFPSAARLMGYAGLGIKEHSTGLSIHRSGLTKTGNAHLRRIVIEAAWNYRYPPKLTAAVRTRHAGQPERIKAIAWAAAIRLYDRYKIHLGHRKLMPQVIAALGRELLGFIWAIGVEVERPYWTPSEGAA